jgi:hypothetical protein
VDLNNYKFLNEVYLHLYQLLDRSSCCQLGLFSFQFIKVFTGFPPRDDSAAVSYSAETS